jgi:D-alanine-D-alanine ligase
VHSQAELEARVAEVHRVYNQAALVEEYIEGRDITASILGNGPAAVVLPLSGIVYPERYAGPKFLTYDAKWESDSPEFRDAASTCPIELPDDIRAMIMDLAARVYAIMGCRDYARVDFRLKGKTAYVLEVNPNPCISPQDSGFVRAATQAGYTYEQLINKIVEHSLLRQGVLLVKPNLDSRVSNLDSRIQ